MMHKLFALYGVLLMLLFAGSLHQGYVWWGSLLTHPHHTGPGEERGHSSAGYWHYHK